MLVTIRLVRCVVVNEVAYACSGCVDEACSDLCLIIMPSHLPRKRESCWWVWFSTEMKMVLVVLAPLPSCCVTCNLSYLCPYGVFCVSAIITYFSAQHIPTRSAAPPYLYEVC